MVKRLSSGVLIVALLAAVVVGWVFAFEHTYADPPASGTHYTPPAPTPTAAQTRALWVGDSFPAGGGATVDTSEATLTGQRLGWDLHLDAEGGTGFLNDGRDDSPGNVPLIDRLRSDRRTNPSPGVVVVDAGRNDEILYRPKVDAAVRHYFTALRQAYPEATIVAILPYDMTRNQPSDLAPVVSAAARSVNGKIVDPLAEGWIGAKQPKGLAADDVHPNPAGHRYIARHLAADFTRLGLG